MKAATEKRIRIEEGRTTFFSCLLGPFGFGLRFVPSSRKFLFATEYDIYEAERSILFSRNLAFLEDDVPKC